MLDVALLTDARALLRSSYLSKIERCLDVLGEDDIWWRASDASNSIGNLILHLDGSTRMWVLRVAGGRQIVRDRDAEFIDENATREQIMAQWNAGWQVLFDTLAALTSDDLTKTITIRHEPYGVIDALHRALAHQAYHVGQIIQVARFLAKDDWMTITIPRGGSRAFNRTMQEKHGQ